MVATLAIPPVTHGAVIVTQAPGRSSSRTNLSDSEGLAVARELLEDSGYTILVVDVIDDAALAGADVFYLSLLPNDLAPIELLPAEVDALVDFVNRGGGLVVQGEHQLWWQQLNVVAERFGVAYEPRSSAGEKTATVVDFATPITDGPYGVVESFGVRDTGILSGDLLALAVDEDGNTLLGALLPNATRSGRVVFMTDRDAFSLSFGRPAASLILRPENTALWLNIFAFAVPEPATGLLLMAGAVALMRRRRSAR